MRTALVSCETAGRTRLVVVQGYPTACMIMHYQWLVVRRSEVERNRGAGRDRRAHRMHHARRNGPG